MKSRFSWLGLLIVVGLLWGGGMVVACKGTRLYVDGFRSPQVRGLLARSQRIAGTLKSGAQFTARVQGVDEKGLRLEVMTSSAPAEAPLGRWSCPVGLLERVEAGEVEIFFHPPPKDNSPPIGEDARR